MPGERWWWDDVYNPFHGCFPVSPGCKNCFVPAWLASHTHPTEAGAVQHGVIIRVNEQWVFSGKLTVLRKGHPLSRKPSEWPGAEHPKLGPGKPSLLWIGDCTDVFIENRPLEIISRALAMVVISKHIGLVLEKRTELMVGYFLSLDPRTVRRWQEKLWLGFSAENQEWFDRRSGVVGKSDSFTGVQGVSNSGDAVIGKSHSGGGGFFLSLSAIGVLGASGGDAGVFGTNDATGAGVKGWSHAGIGVRGSTVVFMTSSIHVILSICPSVHGCFHLLLK